MERLLSVSRELRDKVQQNEGAAGELLRQCEELKEELKAMRQWREVVPSTEESRVQMPNIEFKYIKQLQAENAELRVLLEEHQAAIEMIMTKYREQVGQFMRTEKHEQTLNPDSTTAEELLHRTDQLYTMASVISLTLQEEDTASQKTAEYITQLECENKHLRELLQFTQTGVFDSESTPSPSLTGPHPDSAPSLTGPHPAFLPRASPRNEVAGEEHTHVATPLPSGQTTPILTTPPVVGGAKPLLEQACQALTDTPTDM